jgi:hypothetical protein
MAKISLDECKNFSYTSHVHEKEEQIMKGIKKHVVLVLAIAVALIACKQPTEQINNAKAAIEGVMKAGADKYAVDEYKKLDADLKVAMDEVATQDKKFFKKFGPAKEMLAKVLTDADTLKAALPAKIEAAKNLAVSLQGEARKSLDAAKALLDKAPKGKGTAKDLEALKGDLAGAETAFADIQKAIDGQDYIAAQDKAKSVSAAAAKVAEQVQAAIDKVKGVKK